jgi:uncharacterized protein YgiB involved in biofilm formation
MTPRRRSAYVGFTALTLSATALAGCEQTTRAPGPHDAPVYASLDACKKEHDAKTCDAAWDASVKEQADAKTYVDPAQCNTDWGEGHCRETSTPGGGHLFVPIMAGFMLANLMNQNQRCGPGTGNDCYGGGHAVFIGGGGRMYAGSTYIGDARPDASGRFAPPRTVTVAEGPGGRISPGVTTRGGFGRFFGGGGRGG